jgi:hypothetical protein
MNLLEQSLWWLVPYVVLILLMVHAMMEFTVSLMVQRPPANRKPLPSEELRQRLLALAGEQQSYPFLEGQDCDFEIWRKDEETRHERFFRAKRTNSEHLRFLLDEQRHELRMHQVNRSSSYGIGWMGWRPRLWGYATLSAGPPGQVLTQEIVKVTNRSGWAARPVLWWFQATHSGYRILQTLTPTPLRRWSARRFWGMLYPLSYVIGMGYLVLIMGGLSGRNLLLLIGISAIWWGFWGLFVWAIYGFPAFWRR